MNETFWGLYESQISALKNCASKEEANMVMIETAKFLVESMDLSDEVLTKYDKFGIRKLFAGYNSLGEAVTSFYESEKEYLDPAARNGAIGQKIASVTDKVGETSEELKKLQEAEKELLEKENQLVNLEKELSDWKDKVSHLRSVDANAEKEILNYKEAFEKLDESIKTYGEELEFWEVHLGENSEIVSKMKKYGVQSLNSLISTIDKIKDNIRHDLKALDIVIKKIVEQEQLIREDVLRKQNKVI